MSLEGRIRKLEGTIAKTHIDPKVDAELQEWFKAHPGYLLLTQPENPNEIGMPGGIPSGADSALPKAVWGRRLGLAVLEARSDKPRVTRP